MDSAAWLSLLAFLLPSIVSILSLTSAGKMVTILIDRNDALIEMLTPQPPVTIIHCVEETIQTGGARRRYFRSLNGAKEWAATAQTGTCFIVNVEVHP